ncbi:MAG: hypothetical protein OEV64_06340 [Desulfobulbaceae bacterium]|nr:hypothetical protein [Desulfobulbaceae bacterium]
MKRFTIILFVILCSYGFSTSYANETDITIQDKLNEYNDIQTKGSRLAQEFTQITGCAINPLAGICAIGAYTYLTTPENQRDSLPWYSSTTFLAIMFTILGLILFKDSSKVIIPKALSIPLDAIEGLTEKPATPFIAMAMLMADSKNSFFPEIQRVATSFICSDAFAGTVASPETFASSSTDIASITISSVSIALVFIIIWIVNQAFNFMVFLCPSGLVDFLLVSMKNMLFAAIIGLSVLSPYLGAALSAIIFIFCLLLFAFAFRMTVFGYVTTFDLVFFKLFKVSTPHISSEDKIICFAGKGAKGVPRLSKGYIKMDHNGLVFTYKPWLIFRKRKVTIVKDDEKFQVEKGIITLGLDKLIDTAKAVKTINLAVLPPRYQELEPDVASILGTTIISESKIARGMKGAVAWIRNMFLKSATA